MFRDRVVATASNWLVELRSNVWQTAVTLTPDCENVVLAVRLIVLRMALAKEILVYSSPVAKLKETVRLTGQREVFCSRMT